MFPVRALKHFDFDLRGLLAPISAEAPAGESLRYEGTYDRIRDARTEDDPVLARGIWTIPLKRAEWPQVERLCVEALRTRTKDLQIAAWLLEAWLHLHGFVGVQQGLRLMGALCDEYWETLHPSEDRDLEYRLAPVVSVDEKLPLTLKLVPLTSPSSEDVRAYCWADRETALRGGGNPDAPTQALFQQSAMLTPTPFFRSLLHDVDGAMNACSELESLLERRCGNQAPSMRQLWTTMDSIRGLIDGILTQRNGSEAGPVAVPEESASNGNGVAPEVSSGGPIQSRADAYRRLSEAADYLAMTEPHSPTPYLIRRAIAWGAMRLEDLLPELVHNNGELNEIYRLLQIGREK